ncbi:MAG: glycosyltransferase [Dehalococcoidales bacterium]
MTSEFPLVTIITPVYNGAKYIEELILSVKTQYYPNIEHIIIDDGSNDGGATIAILKRYSHLRWWSRENRGRFATMNEGLEAARGEYVCFISADDLIMTGAVQSVIKTFQENPDYDGVAGLTHFITGDSLPYPIKFPFQTAPIRYYAFFSHIAHCSLYLCRERLFKDDLLFDPSFRYVGDYDWLLRVFAKFRIYRTKLYLSKFRIHTEQTSIRDKQAMDEEHRRVVASHHINKLSYKCFTWLYIGIHDMEKMRYAWTQKGFAGVYRLFVDHILRNKRIPA